MEQVTSEAEVTNVLADEGSENKVEDASSSHRAAVSTIKQLLGEAKSFVAADNVTAQQINTQPSRLK